MVGTGLSRFVQPAPGKDHVDETERGGDQSRCRPTPVGREGSDDRSQHNPGRARGREPPQGAGPVARFDGVGHVGVRHAGRAAAGTLNDPRREQQPERVGEGEHDVCDGGRRQPDEHGRSPPVPVRHPAPHRREQQLRDGVRRDQQPDLLRRGVEPQGIERHQRQHHREADHVDPAGRDQHPQLAKLHLRRRSGSAHRRAIRFRKRRAAPGTAAGSCRKKLTPAYT